MSWSEQAKALAGEDRGPHITVFLLPGQGLGKTAQPACLPGWCAPFLR